MPCPKGAADPIAAEESRRGNAIELEHLESLEAQMDLLRFAIEHERLADYGEPQACDECTRTSFLAHFPGLGAALEEWDEAVARLQRSVGLLWAWFQRAANERGLSEPLFAVGPLIDHLAMLTVERARQGGLRARRRLSLEHVRSRSLPTECVSVYVDGRNIAWLPTEPSAALEQQIEAIRRHVQRLFDDAQASPQAREIAKARKSLVALKRQLLDRLAFHAALEAVVVAVECPFCREREAPVQVKASPATPWGPGLVLDLAPQTWAAV